MCHSRPLWHALIPMNCHGPISVKLAALVLLATIPLTQASASVGTKEPKAGHTRIASASRAAVLLGKPNVKSSSVLVLDEKDSSVLYSRQADVALPIASITKLMTALVV